VAGRAIGRAEVRRGGASRVETLFVAAFAFANDWEHR
jgi:hypothetical protein